MSKILTLFGGDTTSTSPLGCVSCQRNVSFLLILVLLTASCRDTFLSSSDSGGVVGRPTLADISTAIPPGDHDLILTEKSYMINELSRQRFVQKQIDTHRIDGQYANEFSVKLDAYTFAFFRHAGEQGGVYFDIVVTNTDGRSVAHLRVKTGVGASLQGIWNQDDFDAITAYLEGTHFPTMIPPPGPQFERGYKELQDANKAIEAAQQESIPDHRKKDTSGGRDNFLDLFR